MSNLRHYDERRFTRNVMRLESRYEVGQPGARYEFNVKLSLKLARAGVEISDEVLALEADDAVGRFAEELRERYPWVGEVYQTGRSHGWLAIQDRTGGATEEDLRAIDEWVDSEREIFEDDIIARFGPDAPPASEPPPVSGPMSGVREHVPPAEPKPAAVEFFRKYGAGRVGHEDEDARALAIAEQYADDNEWEAVWEEDPEPYETDNEDDRPNEVLRCVLKDAEGNVIGALGGNGMSGNLAEDRRFGRVIEAQLAAEAMVNGGLTPNARSASAIRRDIEAAYYFHERKIVDLEEELRRPGISADYRNDLERQLKESRESMQWAGKRLNKNGGVMFRRNATYQHGDRFVALRTHGKSGSAARAERLQVDVEGLLIGPTSASEARRLVENIFRTHTPEQVAYELNHALVGYQSGSVKGLPDSAQGYAARRVAGMPPAGKRAEVLKLYLENILTGPTSGGNAERLVGSMFRSSSADEIAAHIRSALDRYGMQRNGASDVRTMARWPLSRLRRHQDLIVKQIQRAHDQRNTAALERLQVKEREVEAAIMQREFGNDPDLRRNGARDTLRRDDMAHDRFGAFNALDRVTQRAFVRAARGSATLPSDLGSGYVMVPLGHRAVQVAYEGSRAWKL